MGQWLKLNDFIDNGCLEVYLKLVDLSSLMSSYSFIII